VEVRLALDTNRYIDFARGNIDVTNLLEKAEEIALPFVVVGELRAGFAAGRHGPDNEKNLRRFLAQPGVSVLFADEQTTHQYAAVFRQLRAAGPPVPTNDLWIAALALQHDLVLCTRDRHFDHIQQIPRI
jgi:tRNA(fMet)-specific endonuclease VapC